MKRQNILLGRLLLTLLSILFLITSVAAQDTTIVFDMDRSGDADLTITESLDLFFDRMSIFASVDKGNIMTFSGDLMVDEGIESADYDVEFKSTGTTADLIFDIWGAEISDMLAETGEFDVQMNLIEDNGVLDVFLIANVKRAYLEDSLLFDVEEIQQNPNIAQELQDEINYVLTMYQLPLDTRIEIETFEISGVDELTIKLDMSIEGWSELMAYSASLEYQQDPESVDFVNCLGMSSEEIVHSLLNSESDSKLTITAAGDMISGTLSSTSEQDTFSGSSIAGLEVKLSKSADKTSLSGYITFVDAQTFVSCLMSDFVPKGTVDTLDYTLEGGENTATHTIEAKISDLAEEKDGKLTVSFPSSTTQDVNISVTVPSDMEITSAVGGTIEGGFAKSTPGQSLSVSYGPKEGLDMNLIIIIVIIIIVLLLILRRKKE